MPLSHPTPTPDENRELEELREEVERLRRQVALGERHFQQVLDHQIGFVAVLDPDGRLQRTDRSAREIAGLGTEEVYDKPFCEGSWWGYDDAVRERIRESCRAAAQGERSRFDVDAAVEGGLLPVDFMIAPLYDDDGRVSHLVASGVDISGRRDVESMLREQRQNLEQTVARRTRDLEVANLYLREMSRTLTMAEQRERQRLSRVLHEDLQQLLYGLQIRLSVVEMQLDTLPETVDAVCGVVTPPLKDMKGLCDRAVSLTRTLSVELDPPVLKDEGLCAALQWLTTHIGERYGLAVTLECDLEDTRLSRDVRLLLVQAVRELLFNIVHHAETAKARVSARVIDGIVTVLVADGGSGFDVEKVRHDRQREQTGLGLFSVEERLRFIGARVRVASQPGTGTEITITYAPNASNASNAPNTERREHVS